MLIQNIEDFFANGVVWVANLPQYVSVPLIMALSLVGTVVIVSLILGLIRLVFGQKAVDFIKNIPGRLNNASNGANDSQYRQQSESITKHTVKMPFLSSKNCRCPLHSAMMMR